MTCRDCVKFNQCGIKNGDDRLTRFYLEDICAGNVEQLCEHFEIPNRSEIMSTTQYKFANHVLNRFMEVI